MFENLVMVDVEKSARSVAVIGTGAIGRAVVHRLLADGYDVTVWNRTKRRATELAAIAYGGSRLAFERHRAILASLSRPRFAGEAPEAAAVWDLTLFGVWYDAQLGLLRALDAAREIGIELVEFSEAVNTQLGHVVSGVSASVSEMQQGTYPPGPADLTEHLTVVRHLIELRAGQRLGDGGLSDVAARIEALIADGRGGEGLTAMVG